MSFAWLILTSSASYGRTSRASLQTRRKYESTPYHQATAKVQKKLHSANMRMKFFYSTSIQFLIRQNSGYKLLQRLPIFFTQPSGNPLYVTSTKPRGASAKTMASFLKKEIASS